ncbi:MAG: BatD family protein [Sedimentisphaerales bacterium]|nr:BatD family protein [Sedimentisphaerales bacterium]
MTINKTLITALLLLAAAVPVSGQDIEVLAGAQKEIYAGEPFQYEIHIKGSDQAGQADITPLQPWSPRSLGGSNQSSRRVTIINGRQTVYEDKKYVMAWQLTAPQAGSQTLPGVAVEVNGRTYTANPVRITVIKPETSPGLGLKADLSQSACYVGEPITMTVTWYIPNVDVGGYTFSIPALTDTDNFLVEEVDVPPGRGGKIYSLEVAGTEVQARQSTVTYQGYDVAALTFAKILIPRRVGTIQIAPPAITCNLEVQSQRSSRPRSFFDDPFFGPRREYKRFSSEGEPAILHVKPLPEEGRPADFNGLVGRYTIITAAEPTQVNVGDPITLTIAVSGELLKQVQMPDLMSIRGFADNFRVPSEQSSPTLQVRQKTFKQTIRATNEQVSEIPPIPLSYFDVDKGEYVTLYSKAIPLEVAPTRIVTADQAEGRDLVNLTSEIEAVQRGIAANVYDQTRLLKNEHFSALAALTHPLYLVVLCGPLAMFAGLLVVRLLTTDNPQRQQARRRSSASRRAIKALNHLTNPNQPDYQQQIADILRRYVGDRFDRTAQSLTPRDCRAVLQEAGAPDETVQTFSAALEQCEASRFAGAMADSEKIRAQEIIKLIITIEKTTKK